MNTTPEYVKRWIWKTDLLFSILHKLVLEVFKDYPKHLVHRINLLPRMHELDGQQLRVHLALDRELVISERVDDEKSVLFLFYCLDDPLYKNMFERKIHVSEAVDYSQDVEFIEKRLREELDKIIDDMDHRLRLLRKI